MSDEQRILAINLTGPGSQPDEGEAELSYMPMPAAMDTFATPAIPEPEEVSDCKGAFALLEKVLVTLKKVRYSTAEIFDLAALNLPSLEFVNHLLGVGEVSISITGDAPVEIQESVMAGLWRVRHLDAAGQLIKDYIEVAALPTVVSQSAFQSAHQRLNTSLEDLPQGIANAPALLTEIDEKLSENTVDAAPHVINLTLLPLSPEDLMLLGERLGVGPVTMLSRGYGNCRIGSTACQSTWWIKYYNSEDVLIMNTIEMVDIPAVALAAKEDLEDSAERLDEILELYR